MVPFYIIATMDDPAVILNASGIFFGSTYLYVGVTNVGGFDTSEIGWHCLWVAIIAVVYSLFNFFYFGDPDFGVI